MGQPGTPVEELQRILDAVAAHGGVSAAARALKIKIPTCRSRYDAALIAGLKAQNQAVAGFATANPAAIETPPSNAIPEGQQLRGLSTKVDGEGKTEEQWVKTERAGGEEFAAPPNFLLKGLSVMTDAEGRERVRWQKLDIDAAMQEKAQKAAFEAMCEGLPKLPAIPAPECADIDLLTLYTITDYHIGMLAWDKETGADWDLSIAEDCLVKAFARMIAGAPNSATAVLNQLGDLLHFDSMKPITPEHGHILDADSRYQKVVKVTVRVLMRVIAMLLEKHETVHIKMMEGNHDPAGSIWLRVMFAMLFSNNPRVSVDESPNPYAAYEFGKTLLGFHHGHLIGPQKGLTLPLVFAAQFREMWGRCEFVYIHTGHKHHVDEKEHPGAKVIQHATLAAPDAFAARGGWLSKRQIVSMTYHRARGEIARGIFAP
jgi:hypothetical protein